MTGDHRAREQNSPLTMTCAAMASCSGKVPHRLASVDHQAVAICVRSANRVAGNSRLT